MPRYRNSTLTALTLAAIFVAPMAQNVEAAEKITGVWSCEVSRPGTLAARPVSFVFHSDGTFTYSSQSTVNGGPLFLPFTSRGGGYGEWEKIGRHDYSYRARENMYINGNAGGFFYVESVQRLDQATGQLCSGRPECPKAETKVRLTQFTFGTDGSITGEVDLLPNGSRVQTVCSRLSDTFPSVP